MTEPDREIVCQECKQWFNSDSPFKDAYCGNCRREGYEDIKRFRRPST